MKTYLKSIKQQFEYNKLLGDKTINQLTEEQLFEKVSEEENSIGVLVNHLAGNMLSRWTDFKTTDGEKDFRNRDKEFEDVLKTKEELLKKWNEGWNCLFGALNSLTEKELEDTIYIRNQGHSVIEAINRQLCHYSYHIGQLVFIGKLLRKQDWESLSIPKGKSKEYNQDKFSKEKRDTHFTEEYLKNK